MARPRATPDPAPAANAGGSQPAGRLQGLIAKRLAAAPAKIRTELLDPIHVDNDPERVNERAYVNSIYLEVETAIQDAMDRLAKQRRFPIFG